MPRRRASIDHLAHRRLAAGAVTIAGVATDASPSTDPLDLEAFRRNAYALVDWIVDYLGGLDERPVREPVSPGDVRAKLPAHAPERPESFQAVLADLDRVVVPGLTHWQHPGWLAYFPAQSSPPAVLGELAAAGLGVQGMLWSTSPAATEIESHVLDWLVDLLGVPQDWKTTGPGGGVLQSGASASTHTALVVAREECLQRTEAGPKDMVAYTSSHAHSSIEKGARMAGFGHIRLLETDREFAARPEALAEAVDADRRAGLAPAFVCSAVGTTGTTGVDPVRRMGEIARAEQMWHHVDAAYAGSAMICEEFRHHQDGLELVDSYVFNPHKWLATNLDCSVMWVADRRPLIAALSVLPPYLHNDASESGQVIDYRDWHGPLGRPFRALKLWFRAALLRGGGPAQDDPHPCDVGTRAGGTHRRPRQALHHRADPVRAGVVRSCRRQQGHRRSGGSDQRQRPLLHHRLRPEPTGSATRVSRWVRPGRPEPTSTPCGTSSTNPPDGRPSFRCPP